MSRTIRTALDELVPRAEAEADWEDVLRRAGSLRRRRPLLALALLAAAGALLATPAFGLRDAVLDLIGRRDVAFEKGAPAPAVVRRHFEDLALGAPPRMDPRVIPHQTRRVGSVRRHGREQALWVAPTARGGFCFELEDSEGGCLRNHGAAAQPLSITYSAVARRGRPVEAGTISGWVLDATAARITVEFADGASSDVPFLYVSDPIDAGYFTYDVPAAHRLPPARPKAVVARDREGAEIAREPLRYAAPRARPGSAAPSRPQRLPARPPVAPSKPLQTGAAAGVAVVAGANGAVLFDARGASASATKLLRDRPATFGCFRRRAGGAQALGVSGAFAPTVGLRLYGLRTPFDGCEIQGSGGHRLPDRLGSHSPVEIPLTPAGRRFFADRAAARDLALFVRSRPVQRLRKLPPSDAAAAIARRWPDRTVSLFSRNERPPLGRIGVRADGKRLVLTEVSTTGRLLVVQVVDGRVPRHKLDGLALVF